MNRLVKGFATVCLAGAIIAGSAGTAFAAGKQYNFDLRDNYDYYKRVPWDSSDDVSMGNTSNGWMVSDVSGCRSNADYSINLIRDRSFQPDQFIKSQSAAFCSGQQQNVAISWSSGKFHFDFHTAPDDRIQSISAFAWVTDNR